MDDYGKGLCSQMCPKKEIDLRLREKLVHYFEKTGNSGDPKKFVKEFARSSAGAERYKPDDLRTPDALQKTVEYLLTKIIMDGTKPYHYKYDFIFDRLRAVRQEIVIQNINSISTIKLIVPMIKFLSYSLFLLHTEKISIFDPKICTQHLQEALKIVITKYENLDLKNSEESYVFEDRVLVESIYLLLNIGNPEALHHAIKLPSKLKSSYNFASSFKISINYFKGNNYLVLREVRNLDHLAGAIASLKIPEVRKRILRSFSVSYNKLNLPLEFVSRILFFSGGSNQKVIDLKSFNLEVLENEKGIFVKFEKSRLITLPVGSKEDFVENKLADYHLPDLLLSNV